MEGVSPANRPELKSRALSVTGAFLQQTDPCCAGGRLCEQWRCGALGSASTCPVFAPPCPGSAGSVVGQTPEAVKGTLEQVQLGILAVLATQTFADKCYLSLRSSLS